MARSWPINVMVLVIFLAATVDCAGTSGSKAIPKKRTFLEKLNNLVSMVDRGFRSVGSNVKTLHGNFDLIGALATDRLNSSVRALELLEDRHEPDATTPLLAATTPLTAATTPLPDATRPQSDVTTPQPVVITTRTDACGDKWTQYGTSFFSFCTCTQKCSFNSARNKCREKQAELAKSTSRELENFFILSLKTTHILLGGNDRVKEGTWRWPDGSPLNASYTNWYPGQPDGGKGENCLMLDVRGPRWSDWACAHLFSANSAAFVCEKKHL